MNTVEDRKQITEETLNEKKYFNNYYFSNVFD
jgi:hypothetical protein